MGWDHPRMTYDVDVDDEDDDHDDDDDYDDDDGMMIGVYESHVVY